MPRPNDVGVGIAVALLSPHGRVLLLKRKGAHAAGAWALPGGWVDRGDKSLLDVVAREVKEEVGLTITGATLMEATTEDHSDLNVRTVTLYYVVGPHQWQGRVDICEPEKCSEVRWVFPQEVANMSPLFPGLLQGLQELIGESP